MDTQDLIQLIAQEVIKKLGELDIEKNRPEKILIADNRSIENEKLYEKLVPIWKNTKFIDHFSYEGCKNLDYIIIPNLYNKDLARIALGIDEGEVASVVIEGILHGKKIIVLEDGIYYRKFEDSFNPHFYNLLRSYEKSLIDFDIEIIKEENLFHFLKNQEKSKKENIRIKNKINKKVVTQVDIEKLYNKGFQTIYINEKSILSPLAQDYIRMEKIDILREQG
ncbi:hypothetical protein [Inediibacterium massiliense]|uniref:hypothetical protein n=1 Tax=Inediibacterium massiliense TaxID=1658111 RepID=UPI0006B507D1|nr:hypothetical protein [Inediibacterium massiliense]